MPRNSQGLYTLPPSNPVAPNTLIESTWANTTMEDIGAALTGSLPRDGSAPMTGPLILKSGAPTQSREAVSKSYMDQFIGYATGMPVGAVFAFASGDTPPGYLLCNGQAVSRTTYDTLFAAIGVVYGSGDGTTTFNVPDIRNEFVRGKPADRALGNKQAAAFAAHNHGVSDPGHVHPASGSQTSHAHTLTTNPHTHTVIDPTHTHGGQVGTGTGSGVAGGSGVTQGAISAAATGISIGTTGNIGGTTDAQTPPVSVTVSSATTGVSTGAAGGDETRPQNIALDYYIKAVNDSTSVSAIIGITSSDDQMISIDDTNPVTPELVIHSNVAFGTVKLDASGQVPLGLLPSSTQPLLGYWDASGGQTPSEASPTTNFASGDTFIISVTGTLTVYDPVTLTASPTVVAVGSLLQYIENSVTNPTGWYYVVASSTVVASQVGLSPVGSIAATNVQAGFAEVNGDIAAIQASISGLAAPAASAVTFVPSGTISTTNVQSAIAELDGETQTALGGKVALSGGVMTGPLTVTALTSNGQVESKATGFKFPDATVQASAAYTKAQSDAAFSPIANKYQRTSETKTATGASISWAVPSWAKRITVLLNQVSASAGGNLVSINLGTGGATQVANLVGQRMLVASAISSLTPTAMAQVGLTTATSSKAIGEAQFDILPTGLAWQANSQVSRISDAAQDQCCTYNSFAAAVDFIAMTLTSGNFNGGSFTAIFEG